jgi:hypothetical protein
VVFCLPTLPSRDVGRAFVVAIIGPDILPSAPSRDLGRAFIAATPMHPFSVLCPSILRAVPLHRRPLAPIRRLPRSARTIAAFPNAIETIAAFPLAAPRDLNHHSTAPSRSAPPHANPTLLYPRTRIRRDSGA